MTRLLRKAGFLFSEAARSLADPVFRDGADPRFLPAPIFGIPFSEKEFWQRGNAHLGQRWQPMADRTSAYESLRMARALFTVPVTPYLGSAAHRLDSNLGSVA